jgi:hypothetical protein
MGGQSNDELEEEALRGNLPGGARETHGEAHSEPQEFGVKITSHLPNTNLRATEPVAFNVRMEALPPTSTS